MALSLSRTLCSRRVAVRLLPPNRTFFSFLRKKKTAQIEPPEPVPLLTEDNLFHAFSKSPMPAVRARGEVIQAMAPCPVCASHDHQNYAPIAAQPKTVKFECPDCGWPTHCSEEHWKEDKEHEKYCARLREANEDEHDLRSGRRIWEFEMPGVCLLSTAMNTSDIVYRTTGIRRGRVVLQLGCLLVHARPSVHRHRTVTSASQQTA